MEKPLYKIWEELCDKKKFNYELTNDNKTTIRNKIKNAMDKYDDEIYLYNQENPYEIKKWLENEHHVKCNVEQYQMINGPVYGYKDSHYCHIYWS